LTVSSCRRSSHPRRLIVKDNRNSIRKEVLHLIKFVKKTVAIPIQPNYAAMTKQYNCDYRTVKRYYEAGTKGEVEQIKKRQSSAPLLLSGFEEIIKDKMKPSC
ncbi:hypothetical protein MXL84_14060, partial [Enterococcus gallinarum]|nr:hypothetical protein [Enterococcus gallinarum]